jgi:hypothetical protein
MLEVQTLKRRFRTRDEAGSRWEAERMSIPALLRGSAQILQTAMDSGNPSERILPRWGKNGAPLGAWKTSMNWFAGVYFLGASGSARESSKTVYRVGVDLTQMVPLKFSGKNRNDLLNDGEFFARLNHIAELLCSSNSKVANACNAKLAGTSEEGQGRFQENFSDYTISAPRDEGPEWTLSEPSETQTVAPTVVCTLTFSGLVWWKPLANLYTG